jgi:NADP-dependent 3-hydroxy acid dehydrogenase YdfG
MQTLENKNVLITGAGSGIGRATALAFAHAGARLLLAGRRREPLEETAAQVRELGAQADVHGVDLEDGDAAAALGRHALATLQRVHVLVNNAGHSTRVRSLRYIDPVEFDSVFKVNVEGVYRLTQSLLESMVEHGGGTIITVASTAALNPSLVGGIAYGAAKAAELTMMRGINAELRNAGIRASTIVPGEVNTPVLDNRPVPPSEAARAGMMQAEDVAATILLCASMPQRTLIEQIVMTPTLLRDRSAELAAGADKPE